MRRRFLFVCCGLVALAPFGCSKGGSGVNLAPVKGTVTMGGKPVEGAVVSFNMESAPRVAVGETDANGNYSLMMFDKDDGAVVGQNVVTITGAEVAAAPPTSSDEYAKVMGIGGTAPPKTTKTVIPSKYADLKKALLKVNVKVGPNVHDFKLQE